MRCWRAIYRALRARVKSRDEANLEKHRAQLTLRYNSLILMRFIQGRLALRAAFIWLKFYQKMWQLAADSEIAQTHCTGRLRTICSMSVQFP
jgi:hypothetical protein